MIEPPTAPDAPVREGDVLAGKYRVEKVLGVGGMGVVVAAMHLELEQRVALKFLLKAAAANPAIVARFSREARAAAKITSQHVARVIDVGALEDGTPYIVMEHLEGRDLSDVLLVQGKLSPGVAVDYVLQACEAIAEAHAAGFIHRDLKPSNLFLARQADGTEIIKVLDFGISKAVIIEGLEAEHVGTKKGVVTGTADVFGSPLYMSPEQLKSSRDVDARADVWSLGTILYELCAGAPPFERSTVAESYGAILYERALSLRKRVDSVPEALDAAVLRCLEKDAGLRFPNVAELATALFPFAEHATRQSLERTVAVLCRAGLTVEQPPPEASHAYVLGQAPPGGSTRTSWDTADRAAKPVPSGRVIAVVAGALTLGALGAVAFARMTAKPLPASPAASADTQATAQVAAQAVPTPTAIASATPTVSVAATSEPSASAPPAPLHGRPVPRGGKAPPPPARSREDPDGFGDRK